jgi:hypothetical protein
MAETKLTVADLERELRLKSQHLQELKNEIDEMRELIQRIEEHAQEGDEYLDIDRYNELLAKYNKLATS